MLGCLLIAFYLCQTFPAPVYYTQPVPYFVQQPMVQAVPYYVPGYYVPPPVISIQVGGHGRRWRH